MWWMSVQNGGDDDDKDRLTYLVWVSLAHSLTLFPRKIPSENKTDDKWTQGSHTTYKLPLSVI